ncbi:MAG: DUF1345 domain-containing protein [Caulobacteraceae bacterium]
MSRRSSASCPAPRAATRCSRCSACCSPPARSRCRGSSCTWCSRSITPTVYYLAEEGAGEGHRCGLEFPDDDEPDYWDFLYFSAGIGATSQTADVNIRSKELRRIATAHSLISFAFNTAILATMINLAAGLF